MREADNWGCGSSNRYAEPNETAQTNWSFSSVTLRLSKFIIWEFLVRYHTLEQTNYTKTAAQKVTKKAKVCHYGRFDLKIGFLVVFVTALASGRISMAPTATRFVTKTFSLRGEIRELLFRVKKRSK